MDGWALARRMVGQMDRREEKILAIWMNRWIDEERERQTMDRR